VDDASNDGTPSPTQPTKETAGCSGGEALVVCFLLALLIAAQVGVARAYPVLVREFWLDEIYTYTLSSDPDFKHALVALYDGLEQNPPGFYVILRPLRGLMQDHAEVTLRCVTLLAAYAAFVGTYVTLRQGFSRLAAFTAVAGIWAHPVMLRYAFEARPYALWLALAVWFAYLLGATEKHPKSVWLSLLLGLVAALLCGVHYFGLIVFGLVVGGAGLVAGVRRLMRAGVLIPLSLGPIAWLTLTPFLFHQRAQLSVSTFAHAVDAKDILAFHAEMIPATHLLLAAGVFWLSSLLPRLAASREAIGPRPWPSAIGGLSALLLMPVVLAVLSLTVQPALLPRYALPTVVGLAPLMACLFSRGRPLLLACSCALLIGASLLGLRAFARSAQQPEKGTGMLADIIRENVGDCAVLFELPHKLYPLCHYQPDLAEKCFLLDFDEGEIGGIDNMRRLTRDLGRVFTRHYHRPAMLSWTNVKRCNRVYLVAGYRDPQDTAQIEADYPGFHCRPVKGPLVELVRKGASLGSGPRSGSIHPL
jgi:hypothetical protein